MPFLMQLGSAIPVNVIMFAPAMLLGFIGGLLGALFTVANIKMARFRRRLMAKIRRPSVEKIVRFIEPPVIMVCHHSLVLLFENCVYRMNKKYDGLERPFA